MTDNKNNLSTSFIVDVPPATHFIMHSSELKNVFINQLRMDFLNSKGQDFFAKNCSTVEEDYWKGVWKDQAESRYKVEGDYQVEIATGEETLIDLNVVEPIKVCLEYEWDIQAVDTKEFVTMVYTDCECTVQTLEGKAGDLPGKTTICAFDVPSVTNGIITNNGTCTL